MMTKTKENLKVMVTPDEDATFFIVKVSKRYEKIFMSAMDTLEGDIAQNEAEIAISDDDEVAWMRWYEAKHESPYDQYPDEDYYYDYDNCEDEHEQIEDEMYDHYEDQGLDEDFEREI